MPSSFLWEAIWESTYVIAMCSSTILEFLLDKITPTLATLIIVETLILVE